MSKRIRWITQAAFGRLCGVSRAAVGQATTARRVRTGADGRVDPVDPVNMLFRERQAVRARAKKHPSATKKGARGPSSRDAAERSGARVSRGSLIEQKYKADITLKRRQAALVQIRTAEKKKQLMPTAVAAKWFGNLSANLRVFLTDLPSRVSPGLIAAVETGKAGEVQEKLENEIHGAIERVLAQTDRDTREYLG